MELAFVGEEYGIVSKVCPGKLMEKSSCWGEESRNAPGETAKTARMEDGV